MATTVHFFLFFSVAETFVAVLISFFLRKKIGVKNCEKVKKPEKRGVA
jgi:hypothetical protein